ncbi:unnamed protein product [Acanthoscelides obtectus]|uniref:Nuclear condensin complex subunit 3 C-terminal domain-containing protein n=1 Tax=Acanthoscelides obtectus TaxID=200917 RepID=A0A9P0Q0E7_ACAOB|nr:unnamed protein product [Acanthoscelides obtectus]CAK1672181.1 Condensin complex subunit 3 [Acanthoscelides obtectus]
MFLTLVVNLILYTHKGLLCTHSTFCFKSEETWPLLNNVILTILQAEESVYLERLIQFIGAIYVTLKQKEITKNDVFSPEGCNLSFGILSFLLKASKLANDNIRLNSLKMIHEILNNLMDVEIDESLCEELEKKLIDRLWDPRISVQLEALGTMSRLQNYDNPDDNIIAKFIYLTASSSSKVRQRAIELVAARGDVIKYFVRSTRDKDPAVRLAALKRLASKATFLKTPDKCDILLFALRDSTPSIQKYLPVLLNSWVESYDNNIIQFLKSLKIHTDRNQIQRAVSLYEKVLYIILRNTDLARLSGYVQIVDKVVPYDQLNYETSCYWRTYIEYLHGKGDYFEGEVERMIPELPYFSGHILGFCNSMKTKGLENDSEQQYILKQLFLMTKVFDYADVANRRCLNGLVQCVLRDLPLTTDTTEVVVSALERSIPLAAPRTHFVNEMISEIISPVDVETAVQIHELTQLKVQINCLNNDLDEAVQEKSYLRADALKKELEQKEVELKRLKEERYVQHEITERKNDEPTLNKCLDIAIAAASSKQVTQLTPALRSLKESLIPDFMEHDSWIIKLKALKFYALCCLVDKTVVPTGIQIFTALIYSYSHGEKFEKEILQLCVYAVCDLLILYGPALVAAPNVVDLSESTDEDHQQVFAGSSISEIVDALLAIIKDQENETLVKEWAYLTICKLISNGVAKTASLISMLILKWCEPEGDPNLVSIIGHTLQKIVRISEYSHNLQDASILTIDVLLNDTSPPIYQTVKEDVIKFIVALCKTSPKQMEIQAVLGTDFCCRIRDTYDTKTQLLLSKLLLNLDIPPDAQFLEYLMELCDEVKDNVTNKLVRANVTKFVASLHSKYEKVTFGADDMTKQSAEDDVEPMEDDGDETEDDE